jgi:flagellar hook-associated protein 2
MSTISFGGLASGLDTGALIDQLVAVEQSRANALAKRQSDISSQKTIVGTLSSAVAALGNLARGMDLASEVQPRAATVSDSHLTVASSSTATPGTYDLRVKQLAQAKVVTSKTFASAGAGVAGDGSVTITVGGTPKSITWTSADTLDDIATRITAADAGVNAAVQFDGTSYRIVTIAKATGTTGAQTFSASGLDFTNVAIPSQDSIVAVNGIDITRSTNQIADALPGLTLTLNSASTASEATTKVTVAQDTKAITTKLEDFVKAYNAVNSALHVQLDYTGTAKGTNTLFGDSTLRQLQQQLNTLASNAYGSSNLGALGISRDKTGAMTLDSTKLTAALAANPNALADVFVTNQLSTKLAALTDNYTRAGDGFFAAKTQSLTDRSKALQIQIDRINTGADSLKARLEQQFSKLEQAVSAMQSQSSSFAAMIG